MPDGGTILFGVDESANFTVSGVEDPAGLIAALVAQTRSSVRPAPHVDATTVDVDGRLVVVAQVAPLRLADKPAMVHGRAYLRQADGDYVMHEHELRMVEVEQILMTTPQQYDTQLVEGLTGDDLVPDIVDTYLKNVRRRDRRLSEREDAEILRRTGVMAASGEPTLAGLYAMGDYPQGIYPSLTVTAAVQLPRDERGVRNRDLTNFTGPIPVLLQDLMDWCSRNLSLVNAYTPAGHMVERYELPLSAARELLANALVHRDLSPNTLGTGKSVQVRLTPDNLFVMSPGGLRGVSLEQLESEDHAQAAVNQRLYSISQKLVTPDGFSVIEGEDGGIREVFRAAREQGLRPPTLINTGVQFKALLWRMENSSSTATTIPLVEGSGGLAGTVLNETTLASRKLTKNAPAVISLLLTAGSSTFEELRHSSQLTAGQLRYALNDLLDGGFVHMQGGQGKKDTVYAVDPEKSAELT